MFTIFCKYFYHPLFLKWVKDSLILYDTTYIKVLLIFKTPEANFKGVRIKPERGAGRLLRQDGPSAKIWLIAINALRQPRQDKMQRVSTESEIKINIQGTTIPEARRAPRPIMADQNAIWQNALFG